MFEDVERFAVKTGAGRSRISSVNAVDDAMKDASVGELNLIKVTSVLPEGVERTEQVPQRRGDFRPAVLSTAAGSGQELAAGLGWGMRNDEKGGYVIEHSSKDDEIDMDDYRKKLNKKLDGMAEARGVGLKKKEFAFDRIKVDGDVFGCVIAVLVYLP